MKRFNVPLIILFLALPYAAFVLPAIAERGTRLGWGAIPAVVLLTLGFIATCLAAYFQVLSLFQRYAADLYDLDSEDAGPLVMRLLFGLRPHPPKRPILMVRDGQADPEGSEVIHKVGGPAHLSVASGNVVVTSRLGLLHRVLVPGFYDLDAFERVWDVIDLRPQRRTISVEFMTRDGIPASTAVSVVCRPDLPQLLRRPGGPRGLSGPMMDRITRVALKLTTDKFVLRSAGSDRVSDWVIGIVNGATDGVVRDTLEQYALDDFVNPQRWLVGPELPARVGITPVKLPDLEADILKEVRDVGNDRGIVVESIELGPVQPAEEAVARQWTEFWKARLQRGLDEYMMDVTAEQAQALLDAQTAIQADFIKRVLDSVERLGAGKQDVPLELIYDSILQVVLAMYEGSPEIQYMLSQQGESLVRFVEMILYGPSKTPPSAGVGMPVSLMGQSPIGGLPPSTLPSPVGPQKKP